MKSASGLASFAEQALAAGTGYVWGSFGQICTPDFLAQKTRQYPANVGGNYGNIIRQKWMGRRVTDCIGLVKYYMMADKFGDNPSYVAAYDHGASQHFAEAHEKGPMSTLPEIPGVLLHMDGHVGVYIGGGWAIEARGTAYGVVRTRVRDRPWDAWYKSIWLDYSAQPVVAKSNYTCDTSCIVGIAMGSCYTAKTTGVVQLVAGKSPTSAHVQIVRCIQHGYTLWHIVPLGNPGQEVGIYINGARQFIVRVMK